jgi:hypothetical protein
MTDQSYDPNALAADWAIRVQKAYPGLSTSDIDALRCAYPNGGAFAMLGILPYAQVSVDV